MRRKLPSKDNQNVKSIISIQEWKDYQSKILTTVFPAVRERILAQKDKMVARLNEQRKLLDQNAFPVGSLVMIKDPAFLNKNPRIGKRDAPYIGPYEITRKRS